MADTCNTCSPNQDGLFGRIIGGDLLAPREAFTFVDGIDTRVQIQEVDGKKQVQYDYFPYKAPNASISVSPSVFEVGDTVASATFTLNVTAGNADINTISASPDPGITLTTGANTWTVPNITSGIASNSVAQHTVTVDDDTDKPVVTASTALSARWRYYQGFSTKTTLNEAEIKALANSNVSTGIKTLYGGNRTYTLPASTVNRFIYWAYPEGTPGIQSLTSGGFVVPFTVAGTIPVINTFNVQQNYIVVRTSNALGSGNIQINMS